MRQKTIRKKTNILKKILIKIIRKLGYEMIDQAEISSPYLEPKNNSFSKPGRLSLTVPMGEIKITRPVKSLDIFFKSCTKINLVTQSKKRVFEQEKSEYTIRSLKSLINCINELKISFGNIGINLTIIDHNSFKKDIEKINNLLIKAKINFKIIDLNLDEYSDKITVLSKNNPNIEKNMKSTMASIYKSFECSKNSNDLIYYVEDDYIHQKGALTEMLFAFEKFATILKRDVFILPVDYPYLYKSNELTNLLVGEKYHWRTVRESLLTFLTSNQMINKYYSNLIEMASNESIPFESNLHKIYDNELCLSPVPSLAFHCTNVNSVYGLSPTLNWKEIWNDLEK